MLAIIDGDVVAYNACKPRWQTKAVDGVNLRKLDENGNVIPLEYSDEENKKYLKESWENFQIDLDNLISATYATDYVMAVKGEHNYRYDIYPLYKSNRVKNVTSELNKFVPILRKLSVSAGMSVEAIGREADDLLRIWACEASAAGIPFIICSIDKDLLMIPGLHYRMKEEKIIEITPQDAKRRYYEQVLKGDPVDCIPGAPGIGDVKAAKILKDCETDEEFQEAIVATYMDKIGPGWYNDLLANLKLIHIQKHPFDFIGAEWPVMKYFGGLNGGI
jgi:5'-3' exonuclease